VVEMDWEDVPVLDVTWLERQERLEKARRLQLDWVEERTRRTLLQGCAKEMLIEMAWEELLVLEKSRRTEKAVTRRTKWLEEERIRSNVEMTDLYTNNTVENMEVCQVEPCVTELAVSVDEKNICVVGAFTVRAGNNIMRSGNITHNGVECVWSVDIVQKCEERLQSHQLAIAIGQEEDDFTMKSVMECVSVPVSVPQTDKPVRKETGIVFGKKIFEDIRTPTKPQTFSELLSKFNQNNSSSSKKKGIYKKVRLSKTKSKADNSHSGPAKEQKKNVQEIKIKSTNNPVLNLFKSMQLKRKLEAEVCIHSRGETVSTDGPINTHLCCDIGGGGGGLVRKLRTQFEP
jgi:hypothetical protein